MAESHASSVSSSINSKENYFLIGFMGSGKSHWGRLWAAANEMSFTDLDEEVEKETGKTIAWIFEMKGEDYFRKIEAEMLRSCAGLQNSVIACGGGTPCFFDNIKWMNEQGITIYISCTLQEILARILSEREKRPLLSKLNQGELLFFIEQKLKERKHFYEQAKITVQSGLLTPDSFPLILASLSA